jgi:hypothetical protein
VRAWGGPRRIAVALAGPHVSGAKALEGSKLNVKDKEKLYAEG